MRAWAECGNENCGGHEYNTTLGARQGRCKREMRSGNDEKVKWRHYSDIMEPEKTNYGIKER